MALGMLSTPLFRRPLSCLVALWGVAVVLSGCAETKIVATVIKEITPSAPTGTYKVGNPYEINGVWYYPEEDPHYDQEGIASWYGDPFHGRTTANGETYDMNELTAAHKTLPMPVYVRVTNLENGRSLVLRVNDRGPFVSGRIIDVSRRAAQLLDFQQAGTTHVRVQVVDQETELTYAELGGQPVVPDETLVIAPAPSVQLTEYEISGERFVQIGAYSDADNAFVVSNALTDVGEVQVHRVTNDDGALYRVRLGPYASEDAAEVVLRDVAMRGYPEAVIVVDQ
ncbi:MAG: septal ring lytic transglycosylase RlpA family protein [Rhodospirillaceae bacterium]|jgi:rare lipoprotein A|nr:septal ring lytic transglycosylase RlpA family protein [Rhodospirillaceae bacterium]